MSSFLQGPLLVRAGAGAASRLREEGFAPDLFSTLVGASGGPKWLVLSRLDRVLARRLIGGRETPIDCIGSSIGCFRHACLAQADPLAALSRFESAYVEQSYTARPTSQEVSAESRRLLGLLLGETGVEEILANARVRTHVIVARMRGAESDNGLGFRLRLAAAALGNALSRRALGAFFERIVLSSNVESAPRFEVVGTRHLPLSAENLEDGIMASGTIPMVMSAPRGLRAPEPGLYLDGGILDYHFDFAFETRPGLILYPHFFDRIIPGWFDKALAWRRTPAERLDQVVMLAPSDVFLSSLPGGGVPDRRDFQRYDESERRRIWSGVLSACDRLCDAAEALFEGDAFVDAIRPFGD